MENPSSARFQRALRAMNQQGTHCQDIASCNQAKLDRSGLDNPRHARPVEQPGEMRAHHHLERTVIPIAIIQVHPQGQHCLKHARWWLGPHHARARLTAGAWNRAVARVFGRHTGGRVRSNPVLMPRHKPIRLPGLLKHDRTHDPHVRTTKPVRKSMQSIAGGREQPTFRCGIKILVGGGRPVLPLGDPIEKRQFPRAKPVFDNRYPTLAELVKTCIAIEPTARAVSNAAVDQSSSKHVSRCLARSGPGR